MRGHASAGAFRRSACLSLILVLSTTSAVSAGVTVFQVTSFANPPWSLTYFSGFSGTVGVTTTWPAEMGWQGDRIDIAFALDPNLPPTARHYRFRIVVTQRFAQSFDVSIQAGPSPAGLAEVHREFVDSPRVLAATIPLERFTPGQTNYIRIQGIGVQVGQGQPAGIRWTKWLLSRVDLADAPSVVRWNQLQRLTWYLQNAVQSNGMVRDSLPLSPSQPPYHPASPDAAGFALLGLCAADHLGLLSTAESRVQAILSAYAGYTPGITPTRNVKGHWWHWMNVNTGLPEPGWDDQYTTIGSALLVAGALFAKNHFVTNATIASYADQMYATTDFNAAIHPALDGRVYLAMTASGGEAHGSVGPWNEYMLIVTLALREPNNQRAQAVAWRWLDPANAPKRSYNGIPTLTDNPGAFAPAFWVHQSHFFNPDFATNPTFEAYFVNHQRADSVYCLSELGQSYRYGLTAGVVPSGYSADRIYSHNNVFSPEAVAAWGDVQTVLEFVQDQPPASDPRFRYGLTRVSSVDPNWVPGDAGLVDHLFLMFGLTESINPLFFKQRMPFQPDADADGIADAYDNCPAAWNPRQQDSDGNGVGDACECGLPFADAERDGDVDLRDFARWQTCPTGGAMAERCLCFDRNGNRTLDTTDFHAFLACLGGGGPELPADPNCGN